MFGWRNIYVIKTSPQGWKVSRRTSDFEWLSERLQAEFPKEPGVAFPGIDHLVEYLNKLNKIPALLSSPFFVYFFSCTMEQAFYDRKKVEFEKGFIAGIVNKLNIEGEIPAVQSGQPKAQKDIVELIDEIEQSDKADPRVNFVLEELTASVGNTREIFRQIIEVSTELAPVLTQAKDLFTRLATLYGQLSESHTRLEKHSLPQLPTLSRVYNDTKLIYFSWTNSLENMVNGINRGWVPAMDGIGNGYRELQKNLKIRRDTVSSLSYSSRAHGSLPSIKHHREDKLIAVNALMMTELEKIMKNERDEIVKNNDKMIKFALFDSGLGGGGRVEEVKGLGACGEVGDQK